MRMMVVTKEVSLSTEPGGPWLEFLAYQTALTVPFEPDTIPSCARREAAMQVAADRVAYILQTKGLTDARPWVKRKEGRLMSRVYWDPRRRSPSSYIFMYPDSAEVGLCGHLGSDQRLVEGAINLYVTETALQSARAREAVHLQFPKIRRQAKWKFQHLSPERTLVFAGGRYFLAKAT